MDLIRKPASSSGNGGELDNTAAQTISGNKTFSGAVAFTSTLTPTGGLVGKTDGATIAAGMVGERITWVSGPSSVTLTTTEADWTNAFITLTPGVWMISGGATIGYQTGATAGNGGSTIARLTDGSNNIITNNDRQIYIQTAANANAVNTVYVSFSAVVNINATTVYKIRAFRSDGVGTGTGTIYNQNFARSDLYAVRIA